MDTRKFNFDVGEFIERWNSGTSVQNVADALGIPYSLTHSRACRIKQELGIKLKNFRKERQKTVDVIEKNKHNKKAINIIKSLQDVL